MPLALIWFGLGEGSVIFVLIHAVLWAVALNTFTGFRGVSPTWRMVGQNYGLSQAGYVLRILIPGAFHSILTGLKVGWAFAWRTLIAAELVFGVSSGTEPFTDASAAVNRLEEIYERNTAFLRARFEAYVQGEPLEARVRATYPFVRITTGTYARVDSRYPTAFSPGPASMKRR